MKKLVIAIAGILLLSGCTSDKSTIFTDDEIVQLKKCIELSKNIQLNGNQLVVTNGMMYIKIP